MSIYEENVLDHYHHPRNRGKLENPDIIFTDENPLCGDTITINIDHEKDRITKARFFSSGCAVSQAAASMLFENLEGKKIDDVIKMDKEEILGEFGELSVSRVKCALLALSAVKKALVEHVRD